MPSILTRKLVSRVSVPVALESLAEAIWQLPRRDREALEDVLEEKFVKTVLRRSGEITRLRKGKKLLSLADIKRSLVR